MTVDKETFGILKDGRWAHLFTLQLDNGSSLKLTDFGAAIVLLRVPDRKGNLEHVVLGFRTLQEYESICPLSGNPAFTRFTESNGFSPDCTQTWRNSQIQYVL